jgi:predicted Rossmann fold flavoprotein
MTIPPSTNSTQPPRIAVIGGGAAGFFAAVNIAEKSRNCQVTLFEAAPSPLRKVAISGGGRCNVTHACFDPAQLVEFYPRGNRELRSLFARFQPKDTIAWFRQRGLKLKTEADGRLFPVSDSSSDVIAVLQQAARQAGVRIYTGARVSAVTHLPDNRFEIILHSGETQRYDICVVTVHQAGPWPPHWGILSCRRCRLYFPLR